MKNIIVISSIVCAVLCWSAAAQAFSTHNVTASRTFDATQAEVGDSINVTVNISNFESFALRGMYFCEHMPLGMTIDTASVHINGVSISNYSIEESTELVYPGNVSARWIIESPTTFSESNPLVSNSTMTIVYSITCSASGSYNFDEFNWVGYDVSGATGAFGCSENGDKTAVVFQDNSLPLTLDGVLDGDASLISSIARYQLYAKMNDTTVYVALLDSATQKPFLGNAVIMASETIYLVLARQGVELRFGGVEDPATNVNFIYLDGSTIISVNPQDGGTGGGYLRYNSVNSPTTEAVGMSDVMIGASAGLLEMMVPRTVNGLNTSSCYAWAVIMDNATTSEMSGCAPPAVSDDDRINVVGEISLINASVDIKRWRSMR
jgi:uncharacterized repeat protein (TIGR01451 family)